MSLYKNKKIAIVGLSIEGMDSAKFLASEGAHIILCDRRKKEDIYTSIQDVLPLAQSVFLGSSYLTQVHTVDMLVRTPGMSLHTPEIQQAQKHGVEITSLTKIFFKECIAPIIGVTGTKGKGTTSTLIARMLEQAGKKVWLGGNVGIPLLSQVRHIQKSDVVVLELSSFQLEDVTQSPQVAVVLPITQDHLVNSDPRSSNFHQTRFHYIQAKSSIVRYQKATDLIVYHADDETSSSFSSLTPAKHLRYGKISGKNNDAYVKNDSVYLDASQSATKIVSLNEIQLKGIHNLENIAAASLAVSYFSVPIDAIRFAAIHTKPLPHRLEFVANIHGVSYYDDSFSTTPETSIAAVHSIPVPKIMIIGGSKKGSQYDELVKTLTHKSIKALILIGSTAQEIHAQLVRVGFDRPIVLGSKNMKEIVRASSQLSTTGDAVLLSPGCASFDMFENYKVRGVEFQREVLSMK